MRDQRRGPGFLLTLAAWVLLGGGCTTSFELRDRAADGGTSDGAADLGVDAPGDDAGDAGILDAGTCRQAGDRCCSEATRGAFCVGGLVCSEGYCAQCPGSLFACGNACVDLQTNGRHCGVCGTVCAEGQRCASGTCVLDCPAPGTVCGGRCANLQSDSSHCGACDRACNGVPGSVGTLDRCVSGSCQRSCAPGFGDCDGSASNGCEVDTRTSATHCGGCGLGCAPPRAVGACAAGACSLASCMPGYGNCDGNLGNGCEVDIHRDTAHCGACGRACASNQICREGQCLTQMTACRAGTADCLADMAGCETQTDNDVANCGACGRTCVFPNAAATCSRSLCAIGACSPGYMNCDGNAANGCEARVTSDVANCGMCGRACTSPNGVAACMAGACSLASCNPGYADCDRSAANGCEADLLAGGQSCGGCGLACAPANAVGACVAGRCSIGSCRAGFEDCDGNAANGCEANLTADPVRCGSCAGVCAFPNAGSSCVGGACALGACAAGFGNCDGAAANGCETNVSASTTSCGECGRACSFANASATCSGGVCALGACGLGWGDCDGNPANGCETSLTSSGAHCGACGRTCATGQSCSGGACVLACAPGERVCAGACVDVSSNVSHCGGCGSVCPAGPNAQAVCEAGVCRRRCVAPYGDCDGAAANGCEVNLSLDRAHCGACGASCGSPPHATTRCERAACVLDCASGYQDCDGVASNGCEVAINSDAANCGRCGHACPPASSSRYHTTSSACSTGRCEYQCAAGWGDCNNQEDDGCETSLNTVSHCGSCTMACPADRLAVPVCCATNRGAICCQRTALFLTCLGSSTGIDLTCF